MPLVHRAPAHEYGAPDWMSVGELARRLGIHEDTVYRQLKNGTLPFTYVKVGHQWRIRRSDVDATTPTGTAALLDGDA